jgi:hypothetical protein
MEAEVEKTSCKSLGAPAYGKTSRNNHTLSYTTCRPWCAIVQHPSKARNLGMIIVLHGFSSRAPCSGLAGARSNFRPSKGSDYLDGGSFPECHCAQYPQGMGRHMQVPDSAFEMDAGELKAGDSSFHVAVFGA